MKQKIYKLCSIMLTLAIVLSTCICAIGTVSATEATSGTPQNVTYYVKNGGTGDGKTVETPAASVGAVIETINADGLDADDVATVLIMKRDDFNYQTAAVHNMAYWNAKNEEKDDVIPSAHTAKLVVKPYDTTSVTYLVASNILGRNSEFILSGPTVFEDLTLVCPRKTESMIAANGNSLTFGSGVAYGCYDSYSEPTNTDAATFSIKTINALGVATESYKNSTNVSESITVNFENAYKSSDKKTSFVVGSNSHGSGVYAKDISVIMNNGGLDADIYFGDGHKTAGTTTVNGNININIKKATGVQLYNTRADGSVLRPLTANAVQVIVSAGEFQGKVEDFTNVTLTKGAYYINNISGDPELVEFTETAGTFKVNSENDVKATSAAGVEYYSENGLLTLPAGTYTIGEEAPPATKDYYVQYGGTGDGRSIEAPAKDVAAAIASINEDGLRSVDTAVVNIIPSTQRNLNNGAGFGKIDGETVNVEHGYAAWSEDGTVPAYNATLIVQGYGDEEVYLAYENNVGANTNMRFNGTTILNDITLLAVRNRWRQIEHDGNSITYAAGTKFAYFPYDIYSSNLTYNYANIKSYNVLATYFAINSNSTYNEDFTVIYETDVSCNTTDENNTFYIGAGNKTVTWDNNVNVVLNGNVTASFAINGAVTINKNLNIDAKTAKSLAFWDKGGTMTVKGAINILLNGIDIDGDLFAMENVTAEGGINIVKVVSDVENAVSVTDTAGVYEIAEGYIGVAKNTATGEEFVSSDGIITLPSNASYELRIVDKYVNDGEKISVYKNCAINLNTEVHTEKSGKLFIGWKKADGTWPETNAEYTAGDVLTAQYIDLTESDFAINNVNVTNENGLKLNMGFAQTTAIDAIPNISEKGVIWVKTDIAGGREIRVDEPIVKTWNWDSTDKTKFSAGTTLGVPNKSANSNSVAIDVSSSDYNTFYTARGYINYTDNNGIANIIYSEEESTSAYKLAKEATDSKDIYTTIIEKVKADNEAFVKGINETVVVTYDKSNTSYKRNTDSYDVFSKITGAGGGVKYKRNSVLTDSGVKEEVNLGWLTDNHFNYINQTDIDKNVTNALSAYRGRSWLRDGSAINDAVDQVNYMNKVYNKTIVTGDMVDYLSFGSLYATKTLIADKSINGSILMTTGNHEFSEWCQPDDAVTEKMTLAEKYALLSNSWSNDPTYYSEILETSRGEDNVMIILLDNGRLSGYYADGTLEKLQASVAEAREKNIPVLIFQHVAMSTFNETESKVYFRTDNISFGTESNNDGYTDMRTYNNKGEEVTTFIRKNYDVIKGVFVGHQHEQMYTEITALDDNDAIIDGVYIPQFTLSASAYGCVGEITLEANCEHSFTNYVAKDAAECGKNATEIAKCDNVYCDVTNVRDIEGTALEHSFTNYLPNNDATCQKNATETASCDNGCGETDTRDIENTIVDHKYTDDADATCDFDCGYTRPRGPQLVEEDGVTYYYYNEVKSTETGLVDYNGKTIYINKGRFLGATGLVTIDGKKVYIRNGYFLGATGIVTLDGKKLYIRNGYFLGATGIVTLDGKKLYIRNGYFLGATGLVTIDGKKLYIRNGYFLGATGIVTLDGKKLYIRNGYFLGASGTVTVGGKKYKVVKGIVQ